MSLKIRMARGGRRNLPFYRIVVTDSRSPRDGNFIEKVGTYNPLLSNDNAERVVLNKERLQYWLSQGAIPSERVGVFLAKAGLIEASNACGACLQIWRNSPRCPSRSSGRFSRQRRACRCSRRVSGFSGFAALMRGFEPHACRKSAAFLRNR